MGGMRRRGARGGGGGDVCGGGAREGGVAVNGLPSCAHLPHSQVRVAGLQRRLHGPLLVARSHCCARREHDRGQRLRGRHRRRGVLPPLQLAPVTRHSGAVPPPRSAQRHSRRTGPTLPLFDSPLASHYSRRSMLLRRLSLFLSFAFFVSSFFVSLIFLDVSSILRFQSFLCVRVAWSLAVTSGGHHRELLCGAARGRAFHRSRRRCRLSNLVSIPALASLDFYFTACPFLL
jgi:hypothetical protein